MAEGYANDDQLRQRHVETLARLVENSPFGIYIVDADFRLFLVSVGARPVFAGVEPLIGCDFGEVLRTIWPDPFAGEAIGRFRHTLATGEPYHSADTTERRQNVDAVESYDWQIQRLTLPDGRFGTVCHFYNATRLRAAETALSESEQHYRALVNASSDIAYRMSADWSVMLPLDGRNLVPSSAEPVTNWAWLSHNIPADEHARVRQSIGDAIRERKPFQLEHRVNRPDGSIGWTLSRAVPILDDSKNIVAWFGAASDITDRKRAEVEREKMLESERSARAEAERIGRMKDEFLATLSHELRTPLNAVLGWAQILRLNSELRDEIGEGIAVIERNARAQAQIIEDLLDMNRIISGKVRLNVQQLDLSLILKQAVETVRPTADAKGVALKSVIDSLAGISINGDCDRLQQVMWNLLSNAIKFTPKSGKVHVLLERVNSNVEISVVDTGEGIRTDFLPFVFDRFRQADASTTRRHGGLGLGLSIVKQLLELHAGSIRVKSEGPGKGSSFIVTLPVAIIQHTGESEADRRHPVAGPQNAFGRESCGDVIGLRVVVIDDEPDARDMVRRLLESCEAIVTTTGDCDEAIRLVAGGQFDVLISDIGMPKEDGYSLLRRVRALGKSGGGNIPAVALTAYARAEDRVKAIGAGFQMHVAKPVEATELVMMVAGAAGRTGQSTR